MNDVPMFATPHHLKGSGGGRLDVRPTDKVGGVVAYAAGDDEGFIVTFREDTEYMEYLSKSAGHPIFRLRIMTNMVAPGNTKTVWDHPTTGIAYEISQDPESGEIHTDYEVMEQCENGDIPEPLRFPKAWNRFLRKSTPAQEGLPIEEWGAISKTYAASLKMMNVHTVQALAALSDSNAQNIMGAIKYRDLAKAFLSERAKTALVAAEQEKAARAQEEAAELRRQVKELTESVAQLSAALAQGGMPAAHTLAGQRVAVEYQHAPELKQLAKSKAKQRQKGPPKRDDEPIETAA